MKKLLLIAVLFALTLAASAQNTFKGIVKYKVESTGEVAQKIPDEAATAEVMVFGERLYVSAQKGAIFMNSPFTEALIANGLQKTSCNNFSQLIAYLNANDMELSYQGSGKILVSQTHTLAEMDSLTIVDTEVGHFYYEYVEGETKEIAGVTAKKLIMHSYNVDGVDVPTEMWYTDEIGPKYNVIFNGIKGVPLQCTTNLGDGKAITFTATEVVKGKVKEADFLIPDGYERLDEKALSDFMNELQESIELLQE